MSDTITSSVAFLLICIALVVHLAGIIDAWMTYKELVQSQFSNRAYLRVLAISGMRTAFLRSLQQMGLLPIVILARNYKVLYAVVFISVLSVMKEGWSAYDRHRSNDLWRQYTSTTIRRTEDV